MVLERLSAIQASRRHDLRVTWFRQWCQELGAAVDQLPEMSACPRELYTELVTLRSPTEKQIALVSRRGEPVAVICVRHRERDWVPVTHYVLPGAVAPALPGFLFPALLALGRDLRVAFWRLPAAPTGDPWVRQIESAETYQLDLSSAFEAYWKSTGQIRRVQKARKRCSKLDVVFDHPGSGAQTVREWEKQWREPGAPPRSDLLERTRAVEYLEKHKRAHTVAARDGDDMVAALTLIVHNGDIVWQYSYRDSRYDRYSVGHYLFDIAIHWAAREGYAKFDFGAEYPTQKRLWAPANGKKLEYHIRPPLLDMRAGLAWRMRSLARRVGLATPADSS